jgi:hypothetical protein
MGICDCVSSVVVYFMEIRYMITVLIGLAITAMIMAIAVTITQCWYWYERKIAAWHHEMMVEEFARGWDAAIEATKRK